MTELSDLTGKVFGAWVVLQRKAAAGPTRWVCRCACGVVKDVLATHLKAGRSTNCGCARTRKMVAAAKVVATTHGMYGTKTYYAWKAMRSRCDNPKNASYADYGGRGISYVREWVDFKQFLADLGAAPEGLSLERKNVNGNYSPENCKWATAAEQAANRTNTVVVFLHGERMTLSEFARRAGLKRYVAERLLKEGKSPETIASTATGAD